MPESPSPPVHRAVFLSYASQDREAARRVCAALRSAGVEVWFDTAGGLEHGDEWDAKIRRQIKECVLFIPLISATTQARIEGYFRVEWDVAAERSQGIAQGVPFILPVTIDDTREADALVPERFRKVQWTHVPNGVLTPEVLTRLLRLWSQRTGGVIPETGRATAPTGRAAAPARPLPARAPVPAAPAENALRRPAPAPSSPSAPLRTPVGGPNVASRFGSLEFGGARSDDKKREVVKDEAYYLAEADEFYHRGYFEPALRSYSKVIEHNAANPDAWTAQVRMLIELGQLKEARLWADKALERFPDYPELLAAKAVVQARVPDLDSALAFSDAAIEVRGNTPYVWLARGDVLLARGEARAAYCFEQAMTLGRTDWLHHWQAARIHNFHQNFALGLRYAQQTTELAPTRAVGWLQAGICQVALGNGDRARESLEQARLLDPECPGLIEAIGEANRITSGSALWRRVKNLFS